MKRNRIRAQYCLVLCLHALFDRHHLESSASPAGNQVISAKRIQMEVCISFRDP